MSTVEEIEAAIQRLPPKKAWEVAHWLHDYLDDDWDRQMKEDAKAGRLDKVLAQIDDDINSGLASDFPKKK
jgi:hypothetical protein